MTGSNRTCRRIISTITIIGFFINGILDSTFLISLVAMVKPPPNMNTTISDHLNKLGVNNIQFEWSASQKNSIIGVFMWGFIFSQIPVARLSEIVGPKRVIGWTSLISALLIIGFPFGGQIDFWVAWIMRLLSGFTLFSLMTCIETVAVRWFSPLERTNLMAKSVYKNLGEAFSFFVSGYIIAYFGWQVLFYVSGCLALVWTLAWFYWIYDSPQDHPRITPEEREEILASLEGQVNIKKKYKELPVKEILMNKRVWAMFVAFIFGGASFVTYLTYMPTFMTNVLHFTIEENGVLSCFHFIVYFIMGNIGSYLSTFLIKSKTFSLTTVRKLFAAAGQYISGLLILSLMIFSDSRAYCATALVIAFGLTGLCYGGHLVNALDLAPNFAASITSTALLVGAVTAWSCTRIVNATVSVDNSLDSWKPMLIILAMGYILSSTAFILFGSAEMQDFNNIEKNVRNNSETEKLNC